MGFFDKKYCDVCGEKIGLLGNRKLEDGNLCKHCAKKLSPWFDERRHSTVEQIKKQLAYREENRSKATAFGISRSFGKGSQKLYVDDNARRFTVNRGTDFASDNPDILDFSQAVGCDLNISEHRREKYQTVDGKSVSYNPPRYEYSYDFRATVRVDHPYFDEMRFDLKGSSVDTGEQRMNGTANAGWSFTSAFSGVFGGQRGVNEYNELVQIGNELKAMIDSWKSTAAPAVPAAPAASAEALLIPIRYGSPAPVPYMTNIMGANVSLELKYAAVANVTVSNPSLVQSFGGADALMDTLRNDLVAATNEAVYRCSVQGVDYFQLSAKAAEISQAVQEKVQGKWRASFGLTLNGISMMPFTLTQESQQILNGVRTPAAQPVQPSAPQNSAWTCPYCGAQNTGKFCTGCGAKKE